jgi:large subunit ribosomal protein L20
MRGELRGSSTPETNPLQHAPQLGVCAHLVCLLKKGENPMARVKRGTKRRAKRKKYLKRTKGFFLTKSKLYQSAQEAANRADRYAFRDRRVKKRQYRRLWIQRVGAAARLNGLTYRQLIHGLKVAGVTLDRKVLADIAVKDAPGFALLAETARAAAPPVKKATRKSAAA